MKKKGFTLPELLGVIAVIAALGLLTSPVIIKVIENAQKKAFASSADGVVESIRMDNAKKEYAADTYTIKNGMIVGSDGKNVKKSGGSNEQGSASIDENGQITLVLQNGEWCAKKNYMDKNIEITDYDSNCTIASLRYEKYENGFSVYYNPETMKKCTRGEANSTTGTKTGCMKWYTFNDTTEKSTVDMILDHNTTNVVAYNLTGSNAAMKEILTALNQDTSTWQKSLNPRLIEANAVAKVINASTWTAAGENVTFDKSKYQWLIENTATNGDDNNWGYWTSTPVASSTVYVWAVVWDNVLYNGKLNDDKVNKSNIWGVRPIITVSKSLLS